MTDIPACDRQIFLDMTDIPAARFDFIIEDFKFGMINGSMNFSSNIPANSVYINS